MVLVPQLVPQFGEYWAREQGGPYQHFGSTPGSSGIQGSPESGLSNQVRTGRGAVFGVLTPNFGARSLVITPVCRLWPITRL